MPDHRWVGTELQFEKPDGEWGTRVDLRGPKGERGRGGGGGGTTGGPTLTPAMLSPATDDTPSSFVVVQADQFVLATLEQMLTWLGGTVEPVVVMVDDDEVLVDDETVTL
ncbi:hypothetical protein [Variovorax sp. JS1663]|uniref:hypothetical protein n=1 Tax=Variovorax sp. JS1663 TaxID=1851577 RepID=UPI000B738846|nr:hypothetical protein [Variovorax sp. JS1663]OUL98558.1 hypothetical protein A8M77_31040 [Variovorax sp. JS1663]